MTENIVEEGKDKSFPGQAPSLTLLAAAFVMRRGLLGLRPPLPFFAEPPNLSIAALDCARPAPANVRS